MTGQEQEMLSKVGVVLISGTFGLAQWLADPNLLRAVLIAALCGVVGGFGRAAGVRLWHLGRRRWVRFKNRPKPPTLQP